MSNLFHRAWDDFVRPLIRRPNHFQVAALCYRKKNGRKEVLLVTSRGTGRWILPKGWPMDGKSASEAAAQEAWEEAGVRPARVSRRPVGEYDYVKELDDGLPVPCSTLVYPIKVANLEAEFPECDERTRKWVAPEAAADMVAEDQLKDILRRF